VNDLEHCRCLINTSIKKSKVLSGIYKQRSPMDGELKMIKKIFYIFIMLMINHQLTPGIDKLTQYKSDLLKNNKPGKNWVYLEWDKSFLLKSQSTEAFLKAPTCIKIKDEKIYIVDNLRHKLNVYSMNGVFLKSIGQQGKGPLDFEAPCWLEFQDNAVLVKSDNGIDIFDLNFNFKSRIRIFVTFKRFFVINNHIYYSFHGIYKDKYAFFIKKDMNGKVVNFIIENDIEENDFFKKTKADNFFVFVDGKLFVVPMHFNKIYVYNENLDLLNKIKLDYSLLDKIEKWNDIPECYIFRNENI
jgi:hypothetical protein